MTTTMIQGKEVTLPVQVRHATAAMGSFLVPRGAAAELIAASGLEPAGPTTQKAMVTIGAIRYLDSDLGEYNEFAVAVVVRSHDAPGSGATAARKDFFKGKVATYIHRLPVNQGFTLEAGQTIWGFPKFMTQSTIEVDPHGATTGDLWEGDQHILTLRVAKGWVPSPDRELTLDTYTFRDGVLRVTPFEMRMAQTRMRPGGAAVTLGHHHPMATELRGLGLPKASVFSSGVAQLSATFQPATVLA